MKFANFAVAGSYDNLNFKFSGSVHAHTHARFVACTPCAHTHNDKPSSKPAIPSIYRASHLSGRSRVAVAEALQTVQVVAGRAPGHSLTQSQHSVTLTGRVLGRVAKVTSLRVRARAATRKTEFATHGRPTTPRRARPCTT